MERRKLKQQRMKQSAAALLKEACMKREIKRAKRTKILPQTFQTIDIHKGMDKEISVSNGDMVMRGDGIIVDIGTPYLGVSRGLRRTDNDARYA